MAEQDTSQERTEEPTAKRLEKAREDGQVARSQELSVAAMMIGGASFMYLFGGSMLTGLIEIFTSGFVFDRQAIFFDNLLPAAFGSHAFRSLWVMTPLFVLTLVIALSSAGLIGGYVFSLKSLAPKASKISPLQGFKRIFGLKALVDLIKALTKFSLVGLVLYLVVSQSFSAITQLGFMAIEPSMAAAGEMIIKGTILVTMTLIIAAAIDIPYQIHEFNKKIKMTKQEVKDELKDTEGRPEVKAKIRQKQREMALGSMLEAVADADVVIVNPEHFAVALSYDPGGDSAPIVVAKGVDLIAQTIRERASQSGVALFSSPSLARALYFTTEVKQAVPEALYQAVAQVIAYIFSLNGMRPGSRPWQKPDPEVPPGMRYSANGRLED